MKKQQLDFNIKKIFITKSTCCYLIACAFAFLQSCENDIEKIQSLSEKKVYPTVSGKDYEILKSDSGKVRLKVVAPEIKRFAEIDDPYIEFPAGIEVYFFDSMQNVASQIYANYAILYEVQKLWLARDSVKAENVSTGEQLETEELFWDEANGEIYSDKFTKITSEDGIFFGQNGFESNQNFTKWKLKSSKGTVNIEDEEQPE